MEDGEDGERIHSPRADVEWIVVLGMAVDVGVRVVQCVRHGVNPRRTGWRGEHDVVSEVPVHRVRSTATSTAARMLAQNDTLGATCKKPRDKD